MRILNEAELKSLFANIDEIITANTAFEAILASKKDENPLVDSIGDAFIKVADSFKVYTNYCGNYQTAHRLYYEYLQSKEQFRPAVDVGVFG